MARFIGLAEESSYGNAATIDHWIDVVSESITSDQQMIDVETAGLRARRYRVPGPYRVGGSFDMVVAPDNITLILKAALGSATTTDSGGGAYKHEFTPADTLPSLTLEICPDVGSLSRQVVGVGITSLGFEATAREVLTASVDVIGQKESLVSPSSPTLPSLRPFIFYEGALSLGGSDVANVEAFRFTIENDIPDDAYVLGSRFLPGLRVQGLTVSGDMDVAFLSWDLYKRFFGSATATEPQTSLESVSLTLTFTGESTGDSTSGYENYKLIAEFPKVYFDTSEANFDRRDRIVQSLGWTAIYDSSSGYICKITVINTSSTP
ncbi:MAG: hypothetical protein DRJ38_00075 [Thermoprotei archaeon]|nr:MAG: hypothetical protein DRJ38_00075 [Thermoprotei archaeon]